MNNQTLDKLRQMRLFGMYEAFKTNLEGSIKETLTPDQFIAMLVNSEWDDRKNKSISRLIKLANFRYKASLEQLDYSVERGLDKKLTGWHRWTSLRNTSTCLLQAVQEQVKAIWHQHWAFMPARWDTGYYMLLRPS